LTRDEIENLIEEKQRESMNIPSLSDEAAARLVAEELVETQPVSRDSMKVRDLVAGLKEVNFTGRVLTTSMPVRKLKTVWQIDAMSGVLKRREQE